MLTDVVYFDSWVAAHALIMHRVVRAASCSLIEVKDRHTTGEF